MKRIIIVGSGGSGKSTLAKQVGSNLNIEVIYLDSLFWKPGWIRVSPHDQQEIVKQIIVHDEWVIEGDHIRTQDVRFTAADTIIFLDFARSVCLWRTVSRFFQNRGRNRLGLPAGCPERLKWTLLRWIWRYPRDNRAQVIANIEHYSAGKRVIVLREAREVKQFVSSLRPEDCKPEINDLI